MRTKVWRLILCVRLIGQWEYPIPGEAWFLHVSVRVFWEEISIWTYGQNKAHWLPQLWVGLIHSIEHLIEQKDRGRLNLFTLPDCWAKTSIFSCVQCSWFLGLQDRTGIFTIDSLALRFLNHTIHLPGLPASGQQIVRLLHLQSHMSQ